MSTDHPQTRAEKQKLCWLVVVTSPGSKAHLARPIGARRCCRELRGRTEGREEGAELRDRELEKAMNDLVLGKSRQQTCSASIRSKRA